LLQAEHMESVLPLRLADVRTRDFAS